MVYFLKVARCNERLPGFLHLLQEVPEIRWKILFQLIIKLKQVQATFSMRLQLSDSVRKTFLWCLIAPKTACIMLSSKQIESLICPVVERYHFGAKQSIKDSSAVMLNTKRSPCADVHICLLRWKLKRSLFQR